MGYQGVAMGSFSSTIRSGQMMGTLAFFKHSPRRGRDKQMLGTYVNRELCKTRPPWLNQPGEPTFAIVRLHPDDGERALKRRGVRESRLVSPGWVEISLDSRDALAEAVRWFGIACENPPPTKSRRKKKQAKPARAKKARKAKKKTRK